MSIYKIKNIKGFTLIELVVVIAIVAALAAIGIPAVAGQIAQSKQATLDLNAKLIATQAQTLFNGAEAAGTVSSGTLADGTAVIDGVAIPETDVAVIKFCNEAGVDIVTGTTVAVDITALPVGASPPNIIGWRIDKVVLTKDSKTGTWTRS